MSRGPTPQRRSAIAAALPSILLGSAVACATGPTATDTDSIPGRYYVVQPGQSAFDVARDSGLTVEELIEVNGLHSALEVGAGDRLFLPIAGTATKARAPNSIVHLPRSMKSAAAEPSAPERNDSAPPARADGLLLRWPVDGVVLRAFSAKGRLAYDGMLIAAPAGSLVRATAAGRVVFADAQGTSYGTLVVLQHDDGLTSVYAHLAQVDVHVTQFVAAGEVLGVVGNSGLAAHETPRLHFELRRDRTPFDPEPLLRDFARTP